MEKKKILRELTRGIHMPSFCDEEERCEALDDCTEIDANDCFCCNINRVVRAFNRGIEFQKQKSPWISVEDDLPCNHKELLLSTGYHTVTVFTYKKGGACGMNNKIERNGKWEWEAWKENYLYWMPIPEFPKE